jgi:hypothetical protein
MKSLILYLRIIKEQISERIIFLFHKNGDDKADTYIYKRQRINLLSSKYNLKNFIETGTFLGETVRFARKYFNKVYSIELSDELYLFNKKRFLRFNNVEILHGDSSQVLKNKNLPHSSVLYWLDGHYSGGVTALGEDFSPIINELSAIFNKDSHNFVAIIDDVRLFKNDSNYISLGDLEKYIAENKKDFYYDQDALVILAMGD